MPEQDDRLAKFVKAVDGIEALQLAAAAKIANAIKLKLEAGELPTQAEMRQLDDAKKALIESIGGMVRGDR